MTNTATTEPVRATRFQGSLTRYHRASAAIERFGELKHLPCPFEGVLIEWVEAMDVDSIRADDETARAANAATEAIIDSWDRQSPIAFVVYTRTTIEMFNWWPVKPPSDRVLGFFDRHPGLARLFEAGCWERAGR